MTRAQALEIVAEDYAIDAAYRREERTRLALVLFLAAVITIVALFNPIINAATMPTGHARSSGGAFHAQKGTGSHANRQHRPR